MNAFQVFLEFRKYKKSDGAMSGALGSGVGVGRLELGGWGRGHSSLWCFQLSCNSYKSTL